MIIREIEKKDTADIVRLAEAMHSESPVYSLYPFDPQKVERLCHTFLNQHDWFCAVAESDDGIIGFVGVVIVPTIFGSAKFVEDISFYVVPQKRGTSAALRLIRAVETWGMLNEVEAIRVGITTGTNPESAGQFFLRLGYEETGQLYTRLVGMNN